MKMQDEVEDTWQPNPHDSILHKVQVNCSNSKIKSDNQQDEDLYTLYHGGIKQQLKNVSYNQINKLTKNVAFFEENIQNIQEKANSDEKEENENMMFEDNNNSVQNKANDQFQKQIEDEDFYDPLLDDKYESWAKQALRHVNPDCLIVLSCPFCFSQVSFDCTQKDKNFISKSVQNVKINCEKPVIPKYILKSRQDKTKSNLQQSNLSDRVSNNAIEINADLDPKLELKILQNQLDQFELYFALECKQCDTQIGYYEATTRDYIFTNVAPGLG